MLRQNLYLIPGDLLLSISRTSSATRGMRPKAAANPRYAQDPPSTERYCKLLKK